MLLGCLFISAHSISSISPATMVAEKPKEEQRMKYNYYVALTGQERWMVIESPNRFRNKLISAGRYTDAVDELLIKAANAKVKKFQVAERRI